MPFEIFYFFPKKKTLTIWNVKAYYVGGVGGGGNKGKIINLLSAEYFQKVVKVKHVLEVWKNKSSPHLLFFRCHSSHPQISYWQEGITESIDQFIVTSSLGINFSPDFSHCMITIISLVFICSHCVDVCKIFNRTVCAGENFIFFFFFFSFVILMS